MMFNDEVNNFSVTSGQRHCFHCSAIASITSLSRSRYISSDSKPGEDRISVQVSLCLREPTIWVPTRSDTNLTVNSQKMVRGLKFWIYKVEELYYPCSENKGADQFRNYCEADLRLCFCLCRLLVLP